MLAFLRFWGEKRLLASTFCRQREDAFGQWGAAHSRAFLWPKAGPRIIKRFSR
jgi:hypothetical protein